MEMSENLCFFNVVSGYRNAGTGVKRVIKFSKVLTEYAAWNI